VQSGRLQTEEKELAGTVFDSDSSSDLGRPLPLNPTEPVLVDNAEIRGRVLFIHRPHSDLPGSWAYWDQFAGKARCFELRLQGVLKRETDQVYFGGELEKPLDLSWTMKSSAKLGSNIVNSLSKARGVSSHINPEYVQHRDGSIEKQHVVWPLFAADTLVCTPAGQIPPLLTQPFEKTNLADKKSIRFNTTDTFTFVYYTQYIDYLHWRTCNLPIRWMNRGFDEILGTTPINLVAYRLEDQALGHVNTNKRYMARMVFTNTVLGGEDGDEESHTSLSTCSPCKGVACDVGAPNDESENNVVPPDLGGPSDISVCHGKRVTVEQSKRTGVSVMDRLKRIVWCCCA